MFRPEKKGRRKPQIKHASSPSNDKQSQLPADQVPSSKAEEVADVPNPPSPPSLKKRDLPSEIKTETWFPSHEQSDLNVSPSLTLSDNLVSREEVMQLLASIRPSYSVTKLKVIITQ